MTIIGNSIRFELYKRTIASILFPVGGSLARLAENAPAREYLAGPLLFGLILSLLPLIQAAPGEFLRDYQSGGNNFPEHSFHAVANPSQSGVDTDHDGFSGAYELANGSDSQDQQSIPLRLADAFSNCQPLMLSHALSN